MVNPDGVYLSQNGVSGITSSSRRQELLRLNNNKTNFTRWKANGRGVDLNRNFSAGWYRDPNHAKAGSEGYSGTSAVSETESKALVSFLKKHPVRATINFHSVGNVIYWGYGQTGSQYNRDLAIAKKLSSLTGYSRMAFEKGGSKSGGFMDYFITAYKLPSFTIELGSSSKAAPQSISNFPDIWSRNRHAPLLLCLEAP